MFRPGGDIAPVVTGPRSTPEEKIAFEEEMMTHPRTEDSGGDRQMKRALGGVAIAAALTLIALLSPASRWYVALVAMLLGWEISDLYKLIRERAGEG